MPDIDERLQRFLSVDEMLDRFCLVWGRDEVWDTELLIPMRANVFSLAVGRDMAKEWHRHPNRRVIHPERVVFDPGGTCGPDSLNLFRGLEMAPQKGDCADLLALLVHLVSQSADTDAGVTEVLNFVLNWMAYPLQHPGAKMATALVFHGPQGCGKSLFWESFAKIFGKHAVVIGQAALESKYNDVFSRRMFIVADEIAVSYDLHHHRNILKALITSPSIQIEGKFQQVRTEDNHANFVFLSNDVKPLALERDDRRYVVIYCPPKRDDGLYQRVADSTEHGAIEAFYQFLLDRNLTGFHPHSAPPMTTAKADLIELGLKPAERFCRLWLDQEFDLPLWPCSVEQLFRCFKKWSSANGERTPSNQPMFTATVGKSAGTKLKKQKAMPSRGEIGAAITLWLPAGTGAPEGVRQIDFAREAVLAFDPKVSAFCAASFE